MKLLNACGSLMKRLRTDFSSCPTLPSANGPDARASSMQECKKRQLAWHKEDPFSHWLKIVDTGTQNIIGCAQWNILKTNPYEIGRDDTSAYWWPEGEGRNFASTALEQWFGPRDKILNTPHLCKF